MQSVNMHNALGLVVGTPGSRRWCSVIIITVLAISYHGEPDRCHVVVPEDLRLASFEREGRLRFLIVPLLAASGADMNEGVLRTEAAGKDLGTFI